MRGTARWDLWALEKGGRREEKGAAAGRGKSAPAEEMPGAEKAPKVREHP